MIGRRALAADLATGQTTHQLLAGDRDVVHHIQPQTYVSKHAVQILGLDSSPGKPIQNGALVTVRSLQPAPRHGDGYIDGH